MVQKSISNVKETGVLENKMISSMKVRIQLWVQGRASGNLVNRMLDLTDSLKIEHTY